MRILLPRRQTCVVTGTAACASAPKWVEGPGVEIKKRRGESKQQCLTSAMVVDLVHHFREGLFLAELPEVQRCLDVGQQQPVHVHGLHIPVQL